MEIKKSYYAIIPASVRYDKSLPAAAKLLYGEITALCNQSGVCWADNEYFCALYEVSERTVQRWIGALVSNGHVIRNYRKDETGSYILDRCLSLPEVAPNDTTPTTKMSGGGDKGVVKGATNVSPIILQDNTTMNTTNNNPPTPAKKRQLFEGMVYNSELPESVKAALLKWLEYKKYAYQEMGFKTLLTVVLKKVTEYGAEAVVELVDECISNGWKGLIWEKLLKRSTIGAAKKPQRNYDEE